MTKTPDERDAEAFTARERTKRAFVLRELTERALRRRPKRFVNSRVASSVQRNIEIHIHKRLTDVRDARY